MQSKISLASALILASSASAQTLHKVTTSDGVEYVPNSLDDVAAGNMVQVTFSRSNEHDIVSGSWDAPCEFNATGGLNSGIHSNGEVFTFTVNSTEPQIFFCSYAVHCQYGMAFAINPSGDNTVAAYQAASQGKTSVGPTSEGPVGGTLGEVSTSNTTSMTTGTASASASASASMTPSSATNASASATPTGSSDASGLAANVAMVGALVVGAMAFVM